MKTTRKMIIVGAIAAPIVVALALSATPAFADDRGTCVIESARHLPKIPGLKIERSVAEQKPGNSSIRSLFAVKINVKAAGAHTTYAYWCGVGADGRVMVMQAGN